jgi:phytoene synthase
MQLDPSLVAKAIPAGSMFYYSLRFSPAALRADLQPLLVWYREVNSIPSLVSDQQVAQAKLSWWHQELRQAVEGESDLPLAQALSMVIKRHQLSLEAFNQIVESMMCDLAQAPHDNFPSLDRYARKVGGNLATLLSQICGAKEADDLELARKLGGFVRQVELIQELGLSLRRNSNPLPTALMQQHGLSHNFLDTDDAAQQLSTLLVELNDRLIDQYSEVVGQIDSKRPQLLPVLIQAELANGLLKTLQKSDFRVLDQRISLTPLQKLWISWRCSKRQRLK